MTDTSDETKEEIAYDEALHITAAEIREMGTKLSAAIPDCAWVPRNSMITRLAAAPTTPVERTMPVDGFSFAVPLLITFTQPFRWVTVNAVITKIKPEGMYDSLN